MLVFAAFTLPGCSRYPSAVDAPEIDLESAANTAIELYDANGDGILDIADVIYLVNYLYKGCLPPNPPEAGDANCDGAVELGDVVYLLNHVLRAGPPPEC